jgi:hypothetical protein
MSNIEVSSAMLPDHLRKAGEKVKNAIKISSVAAAMKLKTYLVQQTDELGITDLGFYKLGFQAIGPVVINDSPHGGVVEEGARPHPVSKEGQEAIYQWCIRKLHLEEKEARQAAFLISQKIKHEGQEGHHLMRDALPKAHDFLVEEFTRVVKT